MPTDSASALRSPNISVAVPEATRRHYGKGDDSNYIISLGKPPKGDLATWINSSRMRIPYPARTFPSSVHVWAAQHSHCRDMAVFNSPTAMDEWLHDLQVARYPASAARVRSQLISGNISCVWDWAPASDYSLFHLDHALQHLIEDLQHYYGPTCELILPLRHYREHRLVPEAAVLRSKASNSGKTADDKSIAKSLEAHLNLALTTYHNDNRPLLEEAFRESPPVSDKDGFMLKTKAFDAQFVPLRYFHAELIARPVELLLATKERVDNGGVTTTRFTAREPRPFVARPGLPSQGVTLTLTAGVAAPDFVQKAKGKVFYAVYQAESWAKNIVCNGKPVCGNFLLRGASACMVVPCPRLHVSLDGVISATA